MNTRLQPTQPTRRGLATKAIIGIVILLLAIVGTIFVINNAASGEQESQDGESRKVQRGDLTTVQRGNFDISVQASGELTALNQEKVRNPLEDRAVITWIVDEGERVKKGDLLIRFADEVIRAEVTEERLQVLSARNEVTAAENELAIQKSQNASNFSQAKTDVEIAELALKQWEKEDAAVLEQKEIALDNAKRNYERLTEKFQESEKLVGEGHISRDEWKRDEIAMIEAEANVKLATTELEVYRNYQSLRERKEFESDVERKREELDRVEKQNEAQLIKANDDLMTKKEQLKIREEELAEEEDQLSKTEVYAPIDGLVVYASSMESGRRGNDSTPPQIGSELRRNDFVIALPDTSQMLAEVKVHESISGQIERGLPARIVSDALPNRSLQGNVLNVSVLAETGGWRDPNRRDYTVRILLEDVDGLGLKPSMRAKAEIMLDRVKDVLYVPIQTIFRKGSQAFVYVPQDGGYAEKAVQIGRASELYVEITDGLEEGDRVLVREPSAAEIVSKLDVTKFTREATEEKESNDDFPERKSAEEMPTTPSNEQSAAGGGAGGDFMAQLDKNKDGKLQKDELPSQMQSYFDRLDSNSDGAIDTAEMEAARKAMGGE